MPKMVAIPGSQKKPLPNAKVIAPAPQDERLEVTVRLRPRTPLPSAADMLKPSAAPRQILSHEDFEKRYGSTTKDFAEIRKFARANGLSVVRESSSRRSVMLSGTVEDFNKAFDVNLQTYSYPNGTYRGREGSVNIPASLAKIVEGVFGLDNRPVAKRRGTPTAPDGAHPFNPDEVAKLYNFPTDADGTGQTIGIIELGGGYRPEDMETYFGKLGLPVPTIIPVSVDGAVNSPSTADSDDGEVVLDIQVASAVAPGAKIVVYFTTNDRASDGFLDAITKAIHDTENNPSVISISWGGPEDPSATGFQQQFDQSLQAAAMLGVTVCIASGDDGAADIGPRAWDGKAHVDFPASSPFALACGGTRIVAANNAVTHESIWNQHKADLSPNAGRNGSFGSGGGGVSEAFAVPAYQNGANVPASINPPGKRGRGVPDVSGAGDPQSGYNILVDGEGFPIGGTSAVAPLWAGLIARINQKLGGRVGFINPQIYSLSPASGAFNDVTDGNNRCTFKQFNNVGYDARPGWDPCSGLGSPNGAKLAGVLTPMTAAPAQAPAAARAPARKKAKAAAPKKAKAPAKKRKRAK
jgi:kumamolisin